MNPTFQTVLQPGFLAFHGNRAEDLAEVVINWIRRHPLHPLEQEIILVQSNGMAEWVKMELARIGGICAATRVELPSRFLWRTYRQVLGREAVPSDSPLDKVPMIWRLMKLLPVLITEPDFAPVAGFLKADEPDRMLQLAAKLADLFDQYQNYRADWLDAWAQGQDHLILANGASTQLPPEQRWQPRLWRAVLQTLKPAQQQSIRPLVAQRVLARLASGKPLESQVARRVIVFGMSQIPWTTLQALAALAPHSQVMLAIPNPCRFYWGDIMDGRELLNSQRRRQPFRLGRDLSALPLEDMHAHAHPLLAAWGRQGRDFIRQLDVFDDAQHSRLKFELARIDLFDETEDDEQTPLLKQVQNRIRDLVPLAEHVANPVAAHDHSIVFHGAHSKVRELEILHDQLLQLLAEPAQQAALKPRDVIVMVPDIEQMAPAIRAVFGQYKRSDARYIPFDIADMSAKTGSPLMGALDWLLRLPQQRCGMSELADLLEVTAVAGRFGIDQESLPRLTGWMAGAGIRWGLNQAHRADLGLLACGDQNSAWFGLRRMLLGYASGAVAVDAPLADFNHIEPFAEVAGLEAELAGSLAHLLQALVNWWQVASTPATPANWAERGRALLAAMVKAESDIDRQALGALEAGLVAWQLACEQAGFDEEVPLIVARSAWQEAIEVPNLNQRFQAGGVTFCTLMPMRAIPFEVVCLLGMNDGDYPRRSERHDFDLMGLPGISRPGDRSRRDDDRQLMLEALVSARRLLYVSWCSHSVRDNSEQPPSVLVSQLRDYLSAGWGRQVVSERTTHHPLQPFGRRYFEAGSPLLTYAREWRAAHGSPDEAAAGLPARGKPPEIEPLATYVADPNMAVTLSQLTRFLRNPVKAFFRQRLQVVFGEDSQEHADDECFAVDGLQEYGLIQELLAAAAAQTSQVQRQASVTSALARLRNAGELPLKGLGDLKQQALHEVLTSMLQTWGAEQARFPAPAERQSVRLQQGDVVLEDWIDHLRQGEVWSDAGAGPAVSQQISVVTAWLELQPGKLLEKGNKPVARADKLLGPWVHSLAIATSGLNAQGVLVGRDGVVDIASMPQDEARNTLGMLLSVWLQGMNAPLPLPPKTALAWLREKNAGAQYEGGYRQSGEVDEPCLARMFPDFEALGADGRFQNLAQQVYAPLLAWANQHVTARFHRAEFMP
ncbi:MAG: exodeoxyribonuclease V subunit gamma [Rhodoferax sp.]|jgi:exodeoxyribonuclease V gamma subunit|nr:exodeoxyribonuclease V subunit gamma [Rhodoferax sp.]